MNELYFRTYCYQACRREDGAMQRELMLLVWTDECGLVEVEDLTEGDRVPRRFWAALQSPNITKLCVDPETEKARLEAVCTEEMQFKGVWVDVHGFLRWAELPEAVVAAGHSVGLWPEVASTESILEERFCRPDRISGRRHSITEEPQLWERLKRQARDYVWKLWKIAASFRGELRLYVRHSKVSGVAQGERFRMSEERLDSYRQLQDELIVLLRQRYEECVETDGGGATELLRSALALQAALRRDYGILADYRAVGGQGISLMDTLKEQQIAQMLFDVLELQAGEELVLLDYGKSMEGMRAWLEISAASLWRTVWMALQTGMEERCGRICAEGRDGWLLLRLPSGRILRFHSPAGLGGDGAWRLVYDRYEKGVWVKHTLRAEKIAECCAAAVLQDWIVEQALLFLPRRQICIADKEKLLICLREGECARIRYHPGGGRLWWTGIRLRPEIAVRKGVAYGTGNGMDGVPDKGLEGDAAVHDAEYRGDIA